MSIEIRKASIELMFFVVVVGGGDVGVSLFPIYMYVQKFQMCHVI